ncbi:putative membrane protein [Methanomicrobium sp. W14]|uniref:DUF2178 domain-containing protein n=1 Tax=Methanomicrobium sp. W14 TaxID=2817839 RepID=UPI001AEA4513|nr:DUF2178 domain-containing protein [Methanomicrobium sp. W14]MBP2134097.1 putative membrane protein [Methanomicrobium sp. W14]
MQRPQGIIVALIFCRVALYSGSKDLPVPVVTIAAIAGAAAIYILRLRLKIDDAVIVDGINSKINEKAGMRKLQVLWVVFLALTISGFSTAMSIENPRIGDRILRGSITQLIFLASILLIYPAFRIYYSRKYRGD